MAWVDPDERPSEAEMQQEAWEHMIANMPRTAEPPSNNPAEGALWMTPDEELRIWHEDGWWRDAGDGRLVEC